MKPIYSRFMLQCLCSIGVAIGIISCGGDNNTSSTAPTNNRNMNYESVVLAANSLSVTVAESLNGQSNMPYVSVTICEPGTYNCKTIHNILLDTGSSGLRIFASAVKSLNLGYYQQPFMNVLFLALVLHGGLCRLQIFGWQVN